MYFLTNKENYIVAASSDFLTTIGSRDICSISGMLHDRLITIDDNKLNIPNKDLEYECNISTMHSTFGNLNLHVLTIATSNPQEDEEKTSIDKLTIDKKDNEYDIPDIPTLHKDEVEINDETKTHIKSIEKIEEKDEPLKEELAEAKKIDTEEVVKEDVSNELEVPKSEDKKDVEESADEELESNKLIDILKNIETDTDDKINITTDNSIEKLADELIETENIDNTNSEINKIAETPQEVKQYVEQSTVSNDIINQLEEIEEPSSKKSGLKKITKKLFPWSSKKNETIELEEEEATPYQIDLKSGSELEEKAKDRSDTLKSVENKIENDSIKLAEVEKEEIKIPEIPSIALEQEDKADDIEESINDIEKITVNKEVETVEASKDIKIPEVPTVALEQDDEDDNIKEDINEIEKIAIDKKVATDKDVQIPTIDIKEPELSINSNTSEKIGLVDLEDETINESIKVDNTNKIDTLKEQISQIDTEKEIEDNKNNTVIADETSIENVENGSIVYKVIKLQVDGIDFEKNANKLSIDTSSYKMLLTNYLDEIEKYNSELENGSSSTIDMLQDAGKLLSVDILTQKLGRLKLEDDRVSIIREISLISSLLKEKMDKKEESVKTYNVPKGEVAEAPKVIEEEQISTSEIPDDVIDITSAQELLTSINPQSVAFNPNRAAEELNLPKTLIIEFIEDFIAQSKEHLPVMVEAYKKEDIKTIQTTAHMLKGAASNLRLDTIAENLFKIQKEGNINNSGELIKQFVAKLKGLNSELASLEDTEDEN